MVAQPPVKLDSTHEVAPPVNGPKAWSPSSWRAMEARQMPKYEDPQVVKEVESILAAQAPLVFAGEVRPCTVLTYILNTVIR